MNKNNRILFTIIVFFLAMYHYAFSQELSLQDVEYDQNISKTRARFSFYQGVNLFNHGYVAESLLSFRRALSAEQNPLYQYMYARVSRAYGLIDQSDILYQTLIDQNFLETYIRGELETSRLQRRETNDLFALSQLVRNKSIDVSSLGYRLPVSTRVLPNGDIAVVFLKSQNIVVLSPSGKIKFNLGTGVGGINYPTDVFYTQSDRFLVPSFTDDKIFSFSESGDDLKEFITSPVIEDTDYDNFIKKFSGPQFLTEDEEGNIYVTTYGSARVFKFTEDGKYLFDFGTPLNNFLGLKNPSGIEIANDRILVADYAPIDNQNNSILYFFDLNGNFLYRKIISLDKIEAIRKIDERYVLLATAKKIIRYDLIQQKVNDEFFQRDFSRVMSASWDKNEILWIVDQDRNRLETFTSLDKQYTGINTQILSIDNRNFPKVEIDFTVYNTKGNPIVGLDRNNVILFENDKSVQNLKMIENVNYDVVDENVILIPSIDSLQDQEHRIRTYESIQYLTDRGQDITLETEKNVNFWFLLTQENPRYVEENVSLSKKLLLALNNYTPSQKEKETLLQTFHFAINTLLPLKGKKVIAFVGSPWEEQNADNIILWDQIRSILEYYHITFVWIDDRLNSSNEGFIQHLTKSFHGSYIKTDHLDKHVMQKLLDVANEGEYTIQYTSTTPISTQDKFVDIKIESYFFSSSDKDILGYMLPDWN